MMILWKLDGPLGSPGYRGAATLISTSPICELSDCRNEHYVGV
jgi:hypothetical protein